MMREISAGGVVVRHQDGEWWLAAIELPKEELPKEELPSEKPPIEKLPNDELHGEVLPREPATQPRPRKRTPRPKAQAVLCLPKGLVDTGEKALDAALREVREETGITAVPVTKLADIKYVYVRTWGDRERVFKIVTFYLLRYDSGRIDDISQEMRVEVAKAKWVRLEDAPQLLAYRGEKQMARKALEYMRSHPEV